MKNRKISLDSSAAESTVANVCARVLHEDIALRSATEADVDFLREVFSSTRVDEFVNAGMPAEQVEPLLASQFSVQHDYYLRHYPRGRFDVIMYRGSRVGRLYHDWSGDTTQLIDIALLPAYRGAGIGSYLLRTLVAEAARKHVPMRLYVEFENPVRSLYRRLGFAAAGENGVYELMQRDALPFEVEGAWAPLTDLSNPFQGSTFA